MFQLKEYIQIIVLYRQFFFPFWFSDFNSGIIFLILEVLIFHVAFSEYLLLVKPLSFCFFFRRYIYLDHILQWNFNCANICRLKFSFSPQFEDIISLLVGFHGWCFKIIKNVLEKLCYTFSFYSAYFKLLFHICFVSLYSNIQIQLPVLNSFLSCI